MDFLGPGPYISIWIEMASEILQLARDALAEARRKEADAAEGLHVAESQLDNAVAEARRRRHARDLARGLHDAARQRIKALEEHNAELRERFDSTLQKNGVVLPPWYRRSAASLAPGGPVRGASVRRGRVCVRGARRPPGAVRAIYWDARDGGCGVCTRGLWCGRGGC